MFDALRVGPYRLLWVSGLGVFLAVMAQNIARGWLAYELTGTNAGLGAVLLSFGLSMLVATPFGGMAADRFPKRLVLMFSMALLVASSAWIGVAVKLEFVEYWMLLVASALQAVAFAFFGPARMAFTAQLVERDTMRNAIVLGQLGLESMRVVGPALAGVLIGVTWFGVGGVFLASAALSAMALLASLRLPRGQPAPDRPLRSPLADMADGIAYLRAEPGLSLLSLTSLGVVMLGFPYLAFLPTVADEIFDVGAGGYGLMSTVSAGGAVVAGLVSVSWASRAEPWRVLGIAGFGFGISLVLIGLAPAFGLVLVGLALLGASGLSFQTTNQSLLLALSDVEYHGRLQGVVMLGFSGFGVAALPLGLLGDLVGLRAVLVGMGVAVCAVMLAFVSGRRRFRAGALVREAASRAAPRTAYGSTTTLPSAVRSMSERSALPASSSE
jgi:predicted MFS family arabinose efflux permease